MMIDNHRRMVAIPNEIANLFITSILVDLILIIVISEEPEPEPDFNAIMGSKSDLINVPYLNSRSNS